MIVYSAVCMVLLIFSIANMQSQPLAPSKHTPKGLILELHSRRAQIYTGSFLFAPLLILFALTALRYKVGKDYQHHLDIFHWIQQSGVDNVYVEKGYAYLNVLISELGLPPETLFVLAALLIVVALFMLAYCFVPSQYWSLFVLLFYLGGAFFSSLNLVRQYYAISLCLFALIAFVNLHWVLALLLFITAILFHSAAILFLVMPLLVLGLKSKYNNFIQKVLLVIYALSCLFIIIDFHQFVILFDVIVPSRWQHYLSDSALLNRDKLAMLKLLIPNLTLILYIARQWYGKPLFLFSPEIGDLESSLITSKENIVAAGLISFVVTQNAFYGVMVLTRLSEVFWVFYFIAIIYLISWVKDTKKRWVLLTLFVLYFIALTVVTIFIKNGNGVMPYTFIFAPNSYF